MNGPARRPAVGRANPEGTRLQKSARARSIMPMGIACGVPASIAATMRALVYSNFQDQKPYRHRNTVNGVRQSFDVKVSGRLPRLGRRKFWFLNFSRPIVVGCPRKNRKMKMNEPTPVPQSPRLHRAHDSAHAVPVPDPSILVGIR